MPAFVLATLGCTEPAVETVELLVDNWWQERSEAEAFRQVVALHEEAYENVDVVTIPRSNDAPAVRILTAQKLLAGGPPSTFQANIGADLLRWAVVNTENGEPGTRRIQGLNALYERTGLARDLPEPLLRALRVGNSLEPYGVPINIHRENVLYYSQQKLEEFEAAHPGQSFLDPAVLCPEVIPADPEAKLDVTFAMGLDPREAWVLVLFAFENVLVSVTSAEFYERLFRGEDPPSASGADWKEDVRKALRCVQYLSRSFVRDQGIETWPQAVAKVQSNQASFTVIGDWANGELAGQLLAGTVTAVPFPGTAGEFVFTSDTFPLPVGIDHEEEVLQFLETIASPRAQLGFSEKKGSIPALRSVSLENPLAQATRDDFDNASKVVLATSGLFPPYFPAQDLQSKLIDLVGAKTNDETQAAIDEVILELENAMPLLRRWQARLLEPAGILP